VKADETVQERPRTEPAAAPFLAALRQMAEAAGEAGDAVQRDRFRQLAAKLETGKLTIAFCGHFSAGKSSLVNALCGARLLPSSPVPTSANVVTITGGAPAARAALRGPDGAMGEARDVPIGELADYCVDGEGVSTIDVTYPIPLLGDELALVDTPGVDSTDAAHRAATESALHLADVVFYVTDYNHVLSDVNFRFLRTLEQWGKPAYLIVNQVDKHREEEIPFAAFRSGLDRSLEAWRIRPAGVLFLSLREPAHPLSQREELVRLIGRLKPLRAELALKSAVRSARYLAGRFRAYLRQRHEAEREALAEALGGMEPAALREERERLEERLRDIRAGSERRWERLRAELDRLLANANLTPAETREKAQAALAAMQPGFKAGWLASAARTEGERQRRLQALADDFNRQVSGHLKGHVLQLLRDEAKEAGWEGPSLEERLEAVVPAVDAPWLAQRMKTGAGADGQATLHYAAEIGESFKSLCRKEARRLHEELEGRRAADTARQEAEAAAELERLAEREEAARQLALLDERESEGERRLLAFLPELPAGMAAPLPAPEPVAAAPQTERAPDAVAAPEAAAAKPPALAAGSGEEERLGVPRAAADLLERAAALIRPWPALSQTADRLQEKAERFRNRRFTIALFGAFSAGKSSFANALVGAPALPVSPNPTTAAINQIVAPTEDYPHGCARVTMKTADQMRDDIRFSLERLGIAADAALLKEGDLESLLALAERTNAEEIHPRGRPHLAFLRAAAAGWNRYGPLLGRVFAADERAYRTYAAEEEAACYVAEIDLHLDAPLTRRGAALVDTPGADSINARHTGVAFEYIRNADAIFFVTYYNHAFTEADRQFLNQLGSVKEAFELDKMFFVVNAADLAASPEELDAVLGHVEAQLSKHGIRRPRLFPVSSLRALEARRSGRPEALRQSGLAAFEEAFDRFASEELGQLALASARSDLSRVHGRLAAMLEEAGADEATRKARIADLMDRAERMKAEWSGTLAETALQPLLQEVDEQLYHLRQRVRYRFGDHFLAAFHPSVLQDDGRDLKKLLESCWLDLKRSVGEDLLQELRAAGLRLEGAVHRLAADRIAAAAARAGLDGFAPEAPPRPDVDWPLPEPYADGPRVEPRTLWHAFKSPKHFFEKDGKKALRDELEALLFDAAGVWLGRLAEAWKRQAAEACRAALREAAERLAAETNEYARELERSLQRPDETDALRGAMEAVARLCKN